MIACDIITHMANMFEQLSRLFGKKPAIQETMAVVPSNPKAHLLDDIINPANTSTGATGEQQVIVPLVINLRPKKPDVILDERGAVITGSRDLLTQRYPDIVRDQDYINPGAPISKSKAKKNF